MFAECFRKIINVSFGEQGKDNLKYAIRISQKKITRKIIWINLGSNPKSFKHGSALTSCFFEDLPPLDFLPIYYFIFQYTPEEKSTNADKALSKYLFPISHEHNVQIS